MEASERALRFAPLLERLVQNDAWPFLRELADEKFKDEMVKFTKAMMRGDMPSEIDVAYKRGYFAGIKFVLDQPEKLLAQIERGGTHV